MSIKIDPEFKNLIPPLSPDEYKQLEDNCVAEGIRDPLVVWELDEPDGIFDSILIDGHNRFEISTKHSGILFNVVRKKFSSRNEVMAWIIQNQFGRRNLSAYDRSVLALKLKPLIQEKAKGNLHQGQEPLQKSVNPVNTQKELAKAAGVSHDTIHKVEKIEAEASEKTKQAIRNGDISINHAFNNLPSQRNRDIVKEAKRQAQKEHLEYLEEKASGTVSIESAKKEKSNMHLLSLEASTQIHKIVRSVMELPLIASDDAIRYLGENMKHSEYLELESNLRTATSVITKLRKELDQAHGKRNL